VLNLHQSPELRAAVIKNAKGPQPDDPSTWGPDTKYDPDRGWMAYERDESFEGDPNSGSAGSWKAGTFSQGLSPWQVIGGLAMGVAPTNSRALATATSLTSLLGPKLVAGFGGGGTAASGSGGAAVASNAAKAGGSMSTGSSILKALGGWGGAINTGLDIFDRLGPVATGASAGAAQGRMAESTDNRLRDLLEQNAAEGNVKADSLRMRQAILASLLGGAEDAKIEAPAHIASRVGKVSGGLRPSALPDRQAISQSIMPRLLASLRTGNHIPRPTPAPGESGFDKAMGYIGTGSALAGSILPALLRRPQPAAPPVATGTMPPGVRF
jgi:hypothetical protein